MIFHVYKKQQMMLSSVGQYTFHTLVEGKMKMDIYVRIDFATHRKLMKNGN